MSNTAPAAARATRARHRRQEPRALERDEGLRLPSTQPPPPMPAMSPRVVTGDRLMTHADADSRYYRLRREAREQAEREAIEALAKHETRESLAELSCFLDSIDAGDRLDGLRDCAGVRQVLRGETWVAL